MSNTYLTIGGMWQKDTARGVVLSVNLTDVVRQRLVKALAETVGGQLVVFENSRQRPGGTDPTHNLVLSVPMDQTIRPAADSPVPKIVEVDPDLPF